MNKMMKAQILTYIKAMKKSRIIDKLQCFETKRWDKEVDIVREHRGEG